MNRSIGVTTFCSLLVIVLLVNLYDNAVLSAGFHVTKVHIRKCRCRVFPNGKFKCRPLFFPKTQVEKLDLIKCFCSKTNQHKFPEFQAACGLWRPGFPISLV